VLDEVTVLLKFWTGWAWTDRTVWTGCWYWICGCDCTTTGWL